MFTFSVLDAATDALLFDIGDDTRFDPDPLGNFKIRVIPIASPDLDPAEVASVDFVLRDGAGDVIAEASDAAAPFDFIGQGGTVLDGLAAGGYTLSATARDGAGAALGAPVESAFTLADDASADADGDLALAPVAAEVDGETGLAAVAFRLTGVDPDITGFEVSLDAGESFAPATATADGPGAWLLDIDLSGYHGAPEGIALVRVTDAAGNRASAEATVAIAYPPAAFPLEIEAETFTVIDATGTGTALTQARVPGNPDASPPAGDADGLWDGFSGQGYIDMGSGIGDAVEFTVEAASAGAYTLGFRYSNGGGGGNGPRPMALTVNGVVAAANPEFAGTGVNGWDNWRTESVTVTLAAGQNTIRLANTVANGPNLDKVTIAPDLTADADGNLTLVATDLADPAQAVFAVAGLDSDIATVAVRVNGGAAQPITPGAAGRFVLDLGGLGAADASVEIEVTDAGGNTASAATTAAIAPAAAFQQTIQAESFAVVDTVGTTGLDLTQARVPGNTETVIPERPTGLWDGHTGQGYMDMGQNAGDAVSFTVEVPAAGTYALSFRYANGGGADRPMALSVDGGAAESLAFAPGSAWTDWRTQTVEVTLTEGSHSFTLANTLATAPNIDRVIVTSVDADASADVDGDLALELVAMDDPAAAVFRVAGVDADVTGFAVRVNGGALQAVTPDASGQFTLDLSGLAPGYSSVAIHVTDGHANEATVTTFVTVGPEGPAPFSAVVEAEAFTIVDSTGTTPQTGLTVVRDASNPETVPDAGPDGLWDGFSGSGYVDMGTNAGDAVSFAVSVPEDGDYTLSFRYAVGGVAARPMVLTLDGATVATVPFESTTTFAEWADVSVSVHLTAGTRSFNLANVGATGPNLDRVTISNGVADTSADADAVPLGLTAVDVSDPAAAVFEVAGVDADIVTVAVRVNGGALQPVLPGAGGQFTLDLGALSAGSASVVVVVTDGAGNQADAATAVVIGGAHAYSVEVQAEAFAIEDTTGTDAASGLSVVRDPSNPGPVSPELPNGFWSDFTGTGYLDMGTQAGDAASFGIVAPADGLYTLTFRYANGGGTGRPMTLSLDGTQVATVPFESTSSFGNWVEVSVEVTLTAGARSFTLANIGNSGPNLDKVTVTSNIEEPTEPGPREVVRIDFQDGAAPNVAGDLVDSFQGYGDRGNGHSYGWVTEASATDADGATNAPIDGASYPAGAIEERTGAPYDGYDPRLTGYARFDHGSYPAGEGGRVAWEMAVENGWYEVTAAVGDTGGPNDSVNRLFIEGELASSFTPSDHYRTELVTTLVQVTDGHLTLSAQGGTQTEIQYLEVRGLPDLTPADGSGAPSDYASFVDPRAVTQEGSDVFFVQLNPSEGFASGVDPNADLFLGIAVVPGRGGVALHSLTDGSFRLVETLTGQAVAITANTTAGSDSVTISPVGHLKPFTSYTLIVDGAVDQGPVGDESAPGREFQKLTSSFVTGELREVEAREVAFDDVVMIDGAADGAYMYTSIELAPDGRHLYVATLQGEIKRWTIDPSTGGVDKSSLETFMPGGDFNDGGGRRGIVGLAFDPTDPDTIWITDNYPVPLDGRNDNVPDFSGRVSKVSLGADGSLTGASVETYITGLPRSNGDHVTNSIEFRANPAHDPATNPDVPPFLMYVVQGSNSAMGEPDSAWGLRPERLLNAAVLEIDPTRTPPAGGFDVATEPLPADGLNRRFADTDNDLKNGGILITSGEHTGKYLHFDSQGVATVREGAIASSALVEDFYNPYADDAVVKIFAEGTRNAYDLVWHSNGHLYVPTNGSAAGGNVPDDPATAVNEGLTGVALQQDYFFRVSEDGYYGHPNPLRDDYILNGGNPTAGTDPNQATTAYPVGTQPDPDYDVASAYGLGFNRSPNGATEYASDVFGSSLKGAVLFTEYSGGNDIRAVLLDANGYVVSDFVLRDLEGNVINSYPDPLDVITNPATGQIYLLTLNRSNGQSQIIRLDPVPGGSDRSADVGGDLAFTPVSLDDPAAAVFAVSGLDTDITALRVSFDGGATSLTLTPTNGQVTLDLTEFGFGSLTATLSAEDASGNVATVAKSFVINEDGVDLVSLVTIQAEDRTPLDGTAVGIATGTAAQIQIRDASNLETSGSAGLVNGLRPGAYGLDGNTDNLDGTPGGYADFGSTNNDFVSFTFDVPEGQEGQAVLRFRYANGSATTATNGGNRPLGIEVNGVTTATADFAPTPGATAEERWANWQVQEVNVTLKAGTNTIILHSLNNTGPNIDQLEVLAAPAFDPDYAEVDGELRIELEQSADMSTRTVSSSAVEFYLKVQDSGLYILDVAANADAPDGQGLTWFVNGVQVGTSTFPGAGDAGERHVMAELAAGTEYQVRVISTAPGASAIDYLDVRQAPSSANAEIVVQSLDAGFHSDRLHFSWMDNPNAMASDGSPRDYKESASVRISNGGTEPLQVLDAELSGPFVLADPAAFENLVLAPGQSVDVEVLFDRSAYTSSVNSANGVFTGVLELTTNDADTPITSIDLAGFWQQRNEGGWEPSINEVWQMFGFGTRVEGVPNLDGVAGSPLNNQDIYEAVNGLEVLSPYWRLAEGVTEAKVTQLAAFHGIGGAGFGIHGPGATQPQVQLTGHADNENQTILPIEADGGFASGTFTNSTIPNAWIGDDVFGIRVAGFSTDPTLNPAGPGTVPEGTQRGHFTRVFVALDEAGNVIPNTYLVIQDYTGINYDYNDNMFVVSGITPVGTGKALVVGGLDDSAADDRLVFTNIDRPATNAGSNAIGGQFFRNETVITLSNPGFADVSVTGMTLGGADAAAFEIVNAPSSIPAGGSVNVTVRFVGHDLVDDDKAVLFKGTLEVESDAFQGNRVIQLAGLAQYQSEGGEEPTVAQIVDAFGYSTDTGGALLNNNAVVETLGDEVLMPYLERLDGGKPIEIIQIAAFLNQSKIERLSLHDVGNGAAKTQLLAQDDNQGQTVLPDGLKVGLGDTGGVARATIDRDTPFGLYVSVDGEPTYISWSDPRANDLDASIGDGFAEGQGHLIRYFQAKDAAGNAIPGTYIGIQDYPGAGNYDYNDMVFVIRNVKAHTLTAAEDADRNGVNDALEQDTDGDGILNFFDPTNVPPSPQTPYGGTAPAFSGDTLTILANSFDEGGQGVAWNDNPGLEGGKTDFRPDRDVELVNAAHDLGFVRPGEWVEYTIDAPKAGIYDLSVLARTPLGGVTVTVSLGDGPTLGVITLEDGNPGGSGFTGTAFAASAAAQVALEAGLQTIRLSFDGTPASNGRLLELRSLTLVAGDEAVPATQTPFGGAAPGFAGDTLTVLANSFDEGGQGVAYNDNAGLDGGKTTFRPDRDVELVNGANDVGYVKSGEWVEYTIDTPRAGIYDLSVLAKTPLPGVTITISLGDGPTLGAITLADGNLGGSAFSAAAFANSAAAQVALGEGPQTIRLSFSGTPAANGNLLELRSMTLVAPEDTTPVAQTPYGGTAPNFVGDTLTLLASSFDEGGQGVAYNDNAGLDGGATAFRPGRAVEIVGDQNDVGYVRPGEWLEYTVHVSTAGDYDLSLIAKTPLPGVTVTASLGDGPALGVITLADGHPGGSSFGQAAFATSPHASITLAEGDQTIRLSFDGTSDSRGYLLDLRSLTLVAPDNPSEPPTEPPSEIDVIGQSGSVSVTQTSKNKWYHVTFDQAIDDAVVVMGPATANGNAPMSFQVRNVTSTGFDWQMDEWDYLDGVHAKETVGWMAVSVGTHTLANGQVITAGHATAGPGVSTVAFAETFAAAPVVLAQVTGATTSGAVTERIGGVVASGFSIQLQEEQAADQAMPTRSLDWIAISKGGSAADGIVAGSTGANATDAATAIGFGGNFDAPFDFIADLQTRNDLDPAVVRLNSLTESGASVYVEEEQSADAEVTHAAEDVGYFAHERGLIFGIDDTLV